MILRIVCHSAYQGEMSGIITAGCDSFIPGLILRIHQFNQSLKALFWAGDGAISKFMDHEVQSTVH